MDDARLGGLPAGHHGAQRDHVQHRQRQHHERDLPLVPDHQRRIADDADHRDRRARELGRQELRDLGVVGDPLREVAGRPLQVEGDRQSQQAVEEAGAPDQRELDLQAGEDGVLEHREAAAEEPDREQDDDDRAELVGGAVGGQHVVDEELRERRDGEAEDHRQQAGGDREGGAPAAVAQARAEAAGDAERPAAALEALGLREGDGGAW